MGTIWEPESDKMTILHSLYENVFSERESYVAENTEVILPPGVKLLPENERVAFVVEGGV
jgi:hypothetical protein